MGFNVLFIVLGMTFSFLLPAILHKYLIVPKANWKQTIENVISKGTGNSPVAIDAGLKRSSYRRRLIIASSKPSHYSNHLSNKISIPASDQNEKFVAKLEPSERQQERRVLYGFFHPYANNGGGGERVLWQAVKSTLEQSENNIVVIYTTNVEASPEAIVDKVESKFKISVDKSRIVLIYLSRFASLIDSNYWKHFTLLGQLVGTMLLTWEAINELSPDVWIDTMGLPSSYLLIYCILKIPILTYTHYPIIQEDMFGKLKFSNMTVCDIRSLSDVKSAVKFMYWSGLYYFYKYLGSLVDIILANGTWTFNHLEKIWYNPELGHQLQILYPPCGTEETETTLDPTLRENKMVYLAQFRPEKRHEVILNEYNQFLKKNYPEVIEPIPEIPTIVFVGSCRTSDDTATLTKLKTQVEKLNLQKFVEFAVDVSYKEVIMWLQKCQFGLNAMWNEHFGIGVVEYMANGAIPIVHASAGPLLDIVTNPGAEVENKVWYNDVGFFFKCFEDPDLDPSIQSGSRTRVNFKSRDGQVVEYPTFSQMLTDLYLSFPDLVKDERLSKVRTAGRLSVIERFSNSAFDVKWKTYLEKLTRLESKYRQERRNDDYRY